MTGPIQITGLAAFSRNLRRMDAALAPGLRLALNEAADVVVQDARPNVPRKTGKAQASIKPKSTRTAVRVSEGGNRAPYVPWLDFGGRVGRNRSVKRPFLKEGRYLYPAYHRKKASGEFERVLTRALINVAHRAGIAVT